MRHGARLIIWLGMALLAYLLADGPVSSVLKAGEPRARLGINLAGLVDWNTELPLADVFKLSREWVSQQQGQPWGKGPPLSLDQHGWVTRLGAGCAAETLLCTIDGNHYPPGIYSVYYEGEGTLEFANAASIVARGRNALSIQVDPGRGNIFLKITATNPQNYVRNIHVLMPGYDRRWRDNPWEARFLQRWQGIACLRFMDWMQTNNSKIASWSQRPTVDDATFTVKGMPLELMIDLANRLKADAWFCIPHRADDDYVRQFAKVVKEKLDPNLKAYVEYSNEVWNGMFEQCKYAGDEGLKLGFASKHWEAGWRYNAWRSVQVFKIWEEVFGSTQRLVRVLASQAANAYVSDQILKFQDAAKHADALAIAPYITCNVYPQGEDLNVAIVEKWNVDQALDYMDFRALAESMRWIEEQKRTASQYGLKLIAYEGGQHMVGVAGGENSQAMMRLFHAANANPRMGQIYQRYLDAWKQNGGDLFCYFTSVGTWSKWGSWGVMQYWDDLPARSAKYTAIMRWAKQQGQEVNAP